MSEDLPKTYDPKTVEEIVTARWATQDYNNPDNLPVRHREPFVVMMPPPNVTGTLHMGHALEASLTDCLIRMKRMQGFKALYLPGMDHAGIATQNAVEKELKEEGKTRHDLGREVFLKRVWEWKKKYGGIILQQLRRLGVSADWSRERFTMDPEYVKAVEAAFAHYQKKGWIYKGERVINWCTRCATSLSDLELEYKEENGKLWHLRYPVKDGDNIIVATTRPETMLGDTAVAVHPDDERYAALVGKTVLLPLANREISIIADENIDRAFGTGAVKVTPAHDLTDASIGERHNLPRIAVIGKDGRMTDVAPKTYRAMKVAEARETIVRDLETQDLIEKIEDYTHNVAICYRCGAAIQPIPSEQWFLKMSELAKIAAAAYEQGKIRVEPESWLRVIVERLANERDWCISRQLWWGHKIPIEGENDVLDTWFSSALWPFATLGWPDKTQDLQTYYPTQWMTSAREIVFLWINRMVFSGLELAGDIPYTNVFIHPTVLNKEGKRMSKSLGTGLDPLDFIERYGADATRFGLLWQTTGTQDIRFDESALVAGKKFLNKIWNATRFVLMKTQGAAPPETKPAPAAKDDRELLAALENATATVTHEIEKLRFGQALESFYEFFWHTFCDQYLEKAKARTDDDAKQMLLWILSVSLRVLHPFVPFITDELWEKLPHTQREPLMIAEWPKRN